MSMIPLKMLANGFSMPALGIVSTDILVLISVISVAANTGSADAGIHPITMTSANNVLKIRLKTFRFIDVSSF